MNKNEFMLTVCIPTYNRAKFLSRCLDSLRIQTCREFRIVISDNASQDDTESIVERSFSTDGELVVYYRQNENIGPIANLHFLVQKTTTPWVLFLSDDDYMSDSNAIARIVSTLPDPRSHGAVAFRYRLDGENGTDEDVDNATKVENFKFIDCDGLSFCTAFFRTHYRHFGFLSTIYNKDLLLNNNAFSIDAPSVDIFELLKCALHGQIRIADNVVSVYTNHEGGSISTLKPERWAENIDLLIDLKVRLSTHNKVGLFQRIMIARLSSAYILNDVINKCIINNVVYHEFIIAMKRIYRIYPSAIILGFSLKFAIKCVFYYTKRMISFPVLG